MKFHCHLDKWIVGEWNIQREWKQLFQWPGYRCEVLVGVCGESEIFYSILCYVRCSPVGKGKVGDLGKGRGTVESKSLGRQRG